MSKIDLYSKFIAKQNKISENSSISRKSLIEKDVSTQDIVAALSSKDKDKDKDKDKEKPKTDTSEPAKTTDSSSTTSMDDYYAAHKNDNKKYADNKTQSLDAKVNQPQSGRSTESLSGDNNPTPDSVASSQPKPGQFGSQSGGSNSSSDIAKNNMPKSAGDISMNPSGATTRTFDSRPDTSAIDTNKPTEPKSKDEPTKPSSMKSKPAKPKETENREKRMSRAVQSGSLQDVISGTYGEETQTLTQQIIEKYSCGCGDKMKKKKDK